MTVRAACAVCLRPRQTCICRWVAAVPNVVDVLILQHPMEVANAKGSARLLHLSLSSSRLEVGEQFDTGQLQAWLAGESGGCRRNVLLYPETAGVAAKRRRG